MAVRSAAASKRTERPGFLLDLVTGADTDVDSVQRLAKAGADAISAAAGTTVDCAATLSRQQGSPASAGSAGFAAEIASSEDRYHDGPMAQAISTARPVVTDDGGTSDRWATYRRRLVAAGYGVALAVPVRLDEASTCALVFLAPAGFEFPPKLVVEAEWFAGVASHSMKLALEVRSVRSAGDNLKAVLESRTSIDVACGVIMAQNRCSYADAFSKLAGVSRQRNLKVRSVAENILKATAGGSPATKFTPPVLA